MAEIKIMIGFNNLHLYFYETTKGLVVSDTETDRDADLIGVVSVYEFGEEFTITGFNPSSIWDCIVSMLKCNIENYVQDSEDEITDEAKNKIKEYLDNITSDVKSMITDEISIGVCPSYLRE